jgi:hypothetical protein
MVDTEFADSYIETDTILEALIGADPRAAAVALKALAAASQEWYCQEATRRLDLLPLAGRKYDEDIVAGVPDQPLAFPRIIDGVTLDWNSSTNQAFVPAEVKRACVEEAIALYQAGTSGSLKDLQEQGVSQMSIGGKLSYSFIQGGGSSPLLSAAAKRIMRKYTGAVIR